MIDKKEVACLVKIRITEWVDRLKAAKVIIQEKTGETEPKMKKGPRNAETLRILDAIDLAIDYIQARGATTTGVNRGSMMAVDRFLDEFLKELRKEGP